MIDLVAQYGLPCYGPVLGSNSGGVSNALSFSERGGGSIAVVGSCDYVIADGSLLPKRR